jgi:hypothetical protein
MPQVIYKNRRYNIDLRDKLIHLSRANLNWVLSLSPGSEGRYIVISAPGIKYNPQRNLDVGTIVTLQQKVNPNIYTLHIITTQ